MQKRIERSLAGEKLPGYYPLGEAPVPIWYTRPSSCLGAGVTT